MKVDIKKDVNENKEVVLNYANYAIINIRVTDTQ